jgi:ABC-type Fe3+/spermidine/putrescine transport system ATPase subunit
MTDNVPLLCLRSLAKRFGETIAVEPLDLDIHAGDFVTILGPSGCGKTTLLRMIGGFIPPTQGTIEIDGVDVTGLGPERRPTNMVFQSYGLFPHMTVGQNVGYGLRVAGIAQADRERRIREALALVRMADYADRSSQQLSGGQQQRIALARAIVMRPKVLLLDEPLAALDLKLRQAMQEELGRIHDEIGGTFVFVTHDQNEALALSNRIAVMNSGRLEQVGTPQDVYARPETLFVSTFIGEANLFAGYRRDNRVVLEAGPSFVDNGDDGPVDVVVRPESISVAHASDCFDICVTATRVKSVYLGAVTRDEFRLGSGQALVAYRRDHPPQVGAVDDEVEICWSQQDHRVLRR